MECIEPPVWVGLKFNWSPPLSTTRLMKVHGGKLYGTYFEPVPKDRRVFWTARNEDIFCLRWGVAEFIRGHIRENSPEYVGGYMVGSETYIPAKDYFTASGHRVPWRYAFERRWLYYKLWGRLLYDRETPDEVFRAEFRRRYGPCCCRLKIDPLCRSRIDPPWQWWARRSRSAVVSFSSEKTLTHSLKARLVVTTVERRS